MCMMLRVRGDSKVELFKLREFYLGEEGDEKFKAICLSSMVLSSGELRRESKRVRRGDPF